MGSPDFASSSAGSPSKSLLLLTMAENGDEGDYGIWESP